MSDSAESGLMPVVCLTVGGPGDLREGHRVRARGLVVGLVGSPNRDGGSTTGEVVVGEIARLPAAGEPSHRSYAHRTLSTVPPRWPGGPAAPGSPRPPPLAAGHVRGLPGPHDGRAPGPARGWPSRRVRRDLDSVLPAATDPRPRRGRSVAGSRWPSHPSR